MRSIAALLVLLLAGCAGMDSATRMQFEQARARVEQEPEQALQELNGIVEEFPELVEVRRARAEAFEQLERDKDAFEEWNFIVRVRASKTDEDLIAAHYGVISNGQKLLGDLPHRITEPPRGDERDRIVALQNSFEALLEEYPENRDLLLGKASAMYRLGLYHRARPIAKALVDQNQEDFAARYVLNLVREQEVGVHDRAIREFCELVHATDPNVARQAANHLIVLAEHPAVDPLAKDNLTWHSAANGASQPSSRRSRDLDSTLCRTRGSASRRTTPDAPVQGSRHRPRSQRLGTRVANLVGHARRELPSEAQAC